MTNPNLEMLRRAVENLNELAGELVFVGGCTTGLFITDPGAAEVRTTKDVDAIIEAASYAEYQIFSEELRKAGFREDTRDGAPLCRWLKEETILDVMPLEEKTLGFTNTWYKPAMEAAQIYEIFPSRSIRVVTPPYFCATKLEAFEGRGNDDYLVSHDLEDIIAVIDGRAAIVEEIRSAPRKVCSYISGKVTDFLNNEKFLDALPGHLPPDEASQTRIGMLLEKLKEIAKMREPDSGN